MKRRCRPQFGPLQSTNCSKGLIKVYDQSVVVITADRDVRRVGQTPNFSGETQSDEEAGKATTDRHGRTADADDRPAHKEKTIERGLWFPILKRTKSERGSSSTVRFRDRLRSAGRSDRFVRRLIRPSANVPCSLTLPSTTSRIPRVRAVG
jgi:hypothetical protein